LGVRQKESYVLQSAGARQACFELLHRVTDPEARREIIFQGRAAEASMLEFGGVYYVTAFPEGESSCATAPEASAEAPKASSKTLSGEVHNA